MVWPKAHGGLDAIDVVDVPRPEPGPGEALIQVKACALNHMDLWARKGVPGFKFPLPLIPGCDISGVVVSADGLAPGTEVVVQPGLSCGRCPDCLAGQDMLCASYGILGETQNGGCAEYVVVPRENLLPKPANLSFAEAAAYPLTFLTAWHMLVARAQLQPGERVLIHAAGSGVSSAALQIARLFGARVIATAGSQAKLDKAISFGAEATINYREDTAWAKTVYKWSEKRGVDVVIEHVGASTFNDSIRSLRKGGRLVTCGATTGGQVEISVHRLFFKNLALLGSTMGSKAELHRITRLMAQGVLKPMVDRVLPLSQVREAHRALEAREAFGKVVISMEETS